MKKEHKIILVPATNKSRLFKIDDNLIDTVEIQDKPKDSSAVPYHLYIITDDIIENGDIGICMELYEANKFNANQIVFKMDDEQRDAMESLGGQKKASVFKVIATTDHELYVTIGEHYNTYNKGLLQIPHHIIEAYVENPFDKVLVEYWDKPMLWMSDKPETYSKINSDGTLTVSLVEDKNIHDLKIVELLRRAKFYVEAIRDNEINDTLKTNSVSLSKDIDKWFKENL